MLIALQKILRTTKNNISAALFPTKEEQNDKLTLSVNI